MNSEEILELVVKAADSKLAVDMMALDVREISLLADYFVITHGHSERQINAIVDEVVDKAKENGVEIKQVEGRGGKWILIDLKDVIVHIFTEEERSYYNLEKLWFDAPLVDLNSMVTQA
ncbi:MAG: ribosome silencing factor [Streptococcaceae bacterium]|nr:ribosome silencing factor [Streptococcaceae bacterium]